ncbi:COMM domain-containing protein 5-like [Onthophagus taurus]|uniref:COMM domain-containing protein 5-like n=1 Tax=Onthophagus taurus TaxID=166361 RepID=UPI0039BEA5F8
MDSYSKNLNPKIVENVSEKFQKQLIKLALKSVNESEVILLNDSALLKLKEENNINDEVLYDLVGIYIAVINLFLWNSKEEFEEKLFNAGFPQSFIDNLPFNQNNRDVILSNVQKENTVSVDYKIDISLNNSSLKKIIPPWVILNLNQGEKKVNFSMDSATFHKLRFSLAELLKELQSVKNMNIVKNK